MMASSNKKTVKRKNVSKKKNLGRSKKEYELYQDIKIVIIIAISILLFVCNFGIIGKVGDFISGIFFGLFGVFNYIFSLLLGFVLIFNELNPSNPVAVRKSISLFMISLQLDMAIDLINGVAKSLEKYDIKEIFVYSKDERLGGGLIAGSLNFCLINLIGLTGTVITIVVFTVVFVIVLTEKSLIRSFKDTTEKVKVRTTEDKIFKEELYEDRKREALLRKEEKRRMLEEARKERELESIKRKEEHSLQKSDEEVLRKNKKAVGVTLNTTLSPDSSINDRNTNDDIHEINLNGFEPSTLTYELTGNSFAKEKSVNETFDNLSDIYDKPEEPKINKPKSVTPPIESHNTIVPEKATEIREEIASAPESYEGYVFPPISLLTKGTKKAGDSSAYIRQTAQKLEATLATFGVKATVTDYSQGPSVTRFELQPDIGVKVSRIKNLSDDIKLSLAASEIRIEAPIPGKAAIGIEVPNLESQPVMLRDLLDTNEYKNFDSKLAFAVGKDIAGKPVIYGIDSFPHLLIAGATGSGKSVCINTLIMSIIYKASPDDVKLIMIDPKVVELSVYNGIPHLMLPVVTDIKKAAATLNFAVNEMNERYKKFADVGVRDYSGYISYVNEHGEDDFVRKIPQIVIIVDEMAELMMQEKKSVEESICSLAQLARAAGLYLIIATQRPSVDVITGLIKANMPSRLAFAVSSQIDSRTILDMGGAEELLGKGDMLFFPKGLKKPVRLQGGYVSDKEVYSVVDFLKKQGLSSYDASIEEKIKSCEKSSDNTGSLDGEDTYGDHDPLFADCGYFIIDMNKATSGSLQRKFRIGFNRAARIIDELCDAGVVGPDEGTKPRTVLMSREQFENYLEEYGG